METNRALFNILDLLSVVSGTECVRKASRSSVLVGGSVLLFRVCQDQLDSR